MITVTLKPHVRSGKPHVAILFEKNTRVAAYVQNYPGAEWSEAEQFFYVPYSKDITKALFHYFQKRKYFVDYSAMQDRKKHPAQKTIRNAVAPSVLSPENLVLYKKYRAYLEGLRLSGSTIATYTNFIVGFIAFIDTVPLHAVDNAMVQRYVEQVVKTKAYGISTHRQMISAIKHFAARFEETGIQELELKRPSKNKRLPVVLSRQEIMLLLRATANLKHRSALALLYSAGLRISELLHLRPADLDMDRRRIMIRNSKGRKDRYVVMSVHCIPLLQNYLITYRPQNYFIEGPDGGRYSAVSVRNILKRSCHRAGIKKHVTPHTLRHSYATHLIENGVGLRHVQELLGHSKPETTMIYTHVAQNDLLRIQSPLDHAIETFLDADKKQGFISLSGKMLG
ncbi:MAG: tyrosine-type recombinase/integrase [Flavobacteriaceae bacterium]